MGEQERMDREEEWVPAFRLRELRQAEVERDSLLNENSLLRQAVQAKSLGQVHVLRLDDLQEVTAERDSLAAQLEGLTKPGDTLQSEAGRNQRVVELIRERNEWKARAEEVLEAALQRKERIDSLVAQLEEARKALDFYADPNKWTQPTAWGSRIFDDESEATTDCGKVAREALARLSPQEGE